MHNAKWKWERRVAACEILRGMPPLSHWPDRSQPFDWNKSEVAEWIKAHIDNDVQYVFEFGKSLDALKFDRETKLWRGNPHWTEKLGIDKREAGKQGFMEWRKKNPRPRKVSSP